MNTGESRHSPGELHGVSEGIRTPDPQSHSLEADCPNQEKRQDVTENAEDDWAACWPKMLSRRPDLARIAEAWDRLPEPIRRAILTLVESVK